jgi:hypothetical protein
MSFETDLTARLRADATVAGIVGTRIYWKIRPQNSGLPAIILGTVYGARDQHFEGPMGTQGNRIQIDCMTDGNSAKIAAIALRNAVLTVIESPGTEGDTEFQGGLVNLYRDAVADTASGVVHTETIDATIWFNELIS